MKSAFKKLSKQKRSMDIGLIIAVTLCAIISALLVFSIARSGINEREDVGDSYWKTQVVSMAIGIVVAFITTRIDYRKLVKLWIPITVVALGLTILTFTSLSYRREGADDQAWIRIFGFSLQPSEILKIAFIITFSLHLSKDEDNINKPLHLMLILIHGAIPIALVGAQGDYGTAIIFAAIFGFMLASSGISWKYLLAAPFIAAAGVAGMWFFALGEHHKKRILVLFHPGTDPEGIEYQQDLGLAALRSGGVFGKGLFADKKEYIYVPEMHNDFIFSYAGQVFGFVGSLGILIILAYICLKIFSNSRIARDRLGRFICMGAFGLIFSHCIMNIGMVLKVAPVIGVPLPFLSAGGTAMVSMYAVIGLVLSTYSHRGISYNVFYDEDID